MTGSGATHCTLYYLVSHYLELISNYIKRGKSRRLRGRPRRRWTDGIKAWTGLSLSRCTSQQEALERSRQGICKKLISLIMHIISLGGNSPRDQSKIDIKKYRRSFEKCRRTTSISACGESRYCTNRRNMDEM